MLFDGFMIKLRNKRVVVLSILSSLAVFITFISLAIGFAWYETYTNEKNRLLLFTHKTNLFYQLRFKGLLQTLDLYSESNHSCKKIKKKLQQASLNDISILMVLITNTDTNKVICSDFNRKININLPEVEATDPILIGPFTDPMFNDPILVLTKQVMDKQKKVTIFLNIASLTPELLLATNPEITGALYSSYQTKPLINFRPNSSDNYIEPPLLSKWGSA